MTTKILSNLYLGDTADAIRFGFPTESLQGTLDLTGWHAEEEMRHNDFSTIEEAISIIDKYISNHLPLLVFCHAGIDRSPFIVACYIAKNYEYTPESAYDYVKQERPQTIIHDDWMRKYMLSCSETLKEGEKNDGTLR